MITHDKLGGRTVQLYIPFDYMGKRVESITLSPLRLGHVLRWNEGHWKTMIELLVDMSGVEESLIRDIRYPDADRVMEAFLSLLTPEIRGDIEAGNVPQPRTNSTEAEFAAAMAAVAPATNGGGRPMQGPGAPLPVDTNPGFDLSDEP
jgi:hypothetical protein